jgi:hypothetical protein
VIRVATSHWRATLPAGHCPVGISRGVPRWLSGFWRYPPLHPGPWFRTASRSEFIELYGAQLARLDPRQVLLDLSAMADGGIPVLLCWERPIDILAGRTWCHRHLVAQWLEDRLGIEAPEVGFEGKLSRSCACWRLARDA